MKITDDINPAFLQEPLGNTIRCMKETGFHEWGFKIYRAVQCEDSIWDSYVKALLQNVHEDLEHNGRDHLLEQYARFNTVDVSKLMSAQLSISSARNNFIDWRNQHSIQVPTQPTPSWMPQPASASRRLPRFAYFLYVDQACLDTLEPHLAFKQGPTSQFGKAPPLVAMLVDGDAGDGVLVEENGVLGEYLGWQFYNTRYLASVYDGLHRDSMRERSYQKPPAIGPGGVRSMQLQ